MLYIFLAGVPPFWAESENAIFTAILRGQIDLASEPWPKISSGAKDLVRKMLNINPKERLTAFQVLSKFICYRLITQICSFFSYRGTVWINFPLIGVRIKFGFIWINLDLQITRGSKKMGMLLMYHLTMLFSTGSSSSGP